MPASMGDTLLPVTTHVSPSSSSRSTRVRRAGRATTLAAGAVLALLARRPTPTCPRAGAARPSPSSSTPCTPSGCTWGSRLLLFALIAVAVYLPAMVRGEKLLPDHSAGEPQWIGGPRQGVAELPAPDGVDSRAGGASGRW